MRLRKQHLRECARAALEARGLRVERKPGQGIIPGARLRTFLGSKVSQVAVRTSLDREIGFARHPDGHWMTIPNVDEIVVAVPSDEDPSSAEVFGFERDVMIKCCDAALAAREKGRAKISYKAPIFIALESNQRHPADPTAGLKIKAKWRTLIPLASVTTESSSAESTESFVERVKREFAKLTGVDVSKITLEIRVVS
jgi:hypothetical protein